MMNFRSEFIRTVNDAVENRSHADGGSYHKGEAFVVLVPVPSGIDIDCNDTSGINLDNVNVSIADSQKIFDPKSGEFILDAEELGQTLYKVSGTVR